MAAELHNFLGALLAVLSSLSFCYSIRNLVPKGFLRFILILPIVVFFLLLPLQFHTIHLLGTLSFFISWLATFKLLLFAAGKGPLCSQPSSSSLPHFLAVGCLPIEIKSPADHRHAVVPFTAAAKCTFLAAVIFAIFSRRYLPPNLIPILYCLLIYLLLENLLGAAAAVARAALAVELRPQFNEPYLSTSLQDFWGRRWNLMVTRILRPAVYEPCWSFAAGFVGGKWAQLAAVVATFAVSGLMHELIFFYMGRQWPTWEVTWFFVVHGFCLAAEMAVKAAVGGRLRLPGLVSAPLTIGFVMTTSFWLFFPPFLRFGADVRMFEEYAAVGAFAKNLTSGMITRLWEVK